MNFTDEGYIINIRKHGEKSLILTLLTREHGKLTGYAKGVLSKKNLSTFQLGNLLKVEAYARVDENMPSLKLELISPTAVGFLSDAGKLQTLSSFCALCNICMAEQQPLENLYLCVDKFVKQIDEDVWLVNYSCFEFYLLEFLGVGLDLSSCSATGTNKNLAYISPKTGKAVCQEAGAPYKNRLYLYPHFITNPQITPTLEELKDALKMTEFFLNKNFFAANGLKFPQCRAMLASIVK